MKDGANVNIFFYSLVRLSFFKRIFEMLVILSYLRESIANGAVLSEVFMKETTIFSSTLKSFTFERRLPALVRFNLKMEFSYRFDKLVGIYICGGHSIIFFRSSGQL